MGILTPMKLGLMAIPLLGDNDPCFHHDANLRSWPWWLNWPVSNGVTPQQDWVPAGTQHLLATSQCFLEVCIFAPYILQSHLQITLETSPSVPSNLGLSSSSHLLSQDPSWSFVAGKSIQLFLIFQKATFDCRWNCPFCGSKRPNRYLNDPPIPSCRLNELLLQILCVRLAELLDDRCKRRICPQLMLITKYGSWWLTIRFWICFQAFCWGQIHLYYKTEVFMTGISRDFYLQPDLWHPFFAKPFNLSPKDGSNNPGFHWLIVPSPASPQRLPIHPDSQQLVLPPWRAWWNSFRGRRYSVL